MYDKFKNINVYKRNIRISMKTIQNMIFIFFYDFITPCKSEGCYYLLLIFSFIDIFKYE